jgi:hypothetical protein
MVISPPSRLGEAPQIEGSHRFGGGLASLSFFDLAFEMNPVRIGKLSTSGKAGK